MRPVQLVASLGLAALACVGCGGSAPAGPDASNFCAGSSYDPCNDEHDCTSDLCMPVGSNHLVVCTMVCTVGSAGTCPDMDGTPASCDDNGFCAPVAAATCTAAP